MSSTYSALRKKFTEESAKLVAKSLSQYSAEFLHDLETFDAATIRMRDREEVREWLKVTKSLVAATMQVAHNY
jgi:hypothetical protein